MGLVIGLVGRDAVAASGSWTQTVAGVYSWNNNANWSAAFPNGGSDNAYLTNNIAGDQTVNLNQAITIQNLYLGDSDGSGSFLIAPGTAGSLTMGNNGQFYVTQLASSKGDTISANIAMASIMHVINNSTANPLTLSGVISGSQIASLSEGVGKVIVGGQNTFTGQPWIQSGTVSATHTQALGNSSSSIDFRGSSGLELLNDGTGSNGTIIFGSPNNPNGYNLRYNSSYTATVVVDRVSANSGNTVQLNNLTIGNMDATLAVEGGHGYRLRFVGDSQFGNVNYTTVLVAPNTADVAFNTVTGAASWKLTMDGVGTGTIEGEIGKTMGKLIKSNSSLWVLGGNNTFTPATAAIAVQVNGGALRLTHANALPGGIGVTGGTSLLKLSGGVVELGATDFQRDTGTATNQVQFAGSGGFSAYGANHFVNLGGAGAVKTWASTAGFLGTSSLILNSPYANAQIDFQNPINLNAAVRTIRVDDNPATNTDVALISGVISGTAGSGLTKTGSGTLILGATNTYTAATTVSNGTLLVNGATTNSAVTVVSNAVLGGTGLLGRVTVDAGGAISANDTNTIGTLSVTNLTLAENAVIYWNYDASGPSSDLINVSGALTLPTNATVYVSGTGALPSKGQMFSAGSLSGASTLNGWTITGPGAKPTTHAVRSGTTVSLVTSRGTIVTLQ